MKKTLIMLAVAIFAYAGADGQTKKKVSIENCKLSADQKYITCCKTTNNPAYDIKGKTVATTKPPAKKAATARKSHTRNYQVCKDEGGFYSCCTYKKTYKSVAAR